MSRFQESSSRVKEKAALFVNRSSWAHCVHEVAREAQALDGEFNPQGVIIPGITGEGGRP
jgi:hypothetical protein